MPPSSSSQGAGLRRRGNYEKSQTAARAGGGWLRRPARLAGTTGSRSPRRRATRASRAEQIDPRPEDHVETAGAQVRTRSDLRAARQRSGRLPPRGPPHGSPLFGYPSGARLRSPRVAAWSPPTARPACATASRGAPRKGGHRQGTARIRYSVGPDAAALEESGRLNFRLDGKQAGGLAHRPDLVGGGSRELYAAPQPTVSRFPRVP